MSVPTYLKGTCSSIHYLSSCFLDLSYTEEKQGPHANAFDHAEGMCIASHFIFSGLLKGVCVSFFSFHLKEPAKKKLRDFLLVCFTFLVGKHFA